MSTTSLRSGLALVAFLLVWACPVWVADKAPAGELRVRVEPSQIRGESPLADFSGLVDEQDAVGDLPVKPADAKKGWRIPSQHWKKFPFVATIDTKAHAIRFWNACVRAVGRVW